MMTDGGDDSDARMLRRVKGVSAEETAVKNALAAVEADTGVEKALSIARAYSVADWRKAEEASNKTGPIQSPPSTINPVPVKNIVAQNQYTQSPSVSVAATPLTPAPVNNFASSIAKTVTNPIKTATPDIVLFDDSAVPVEIMADLVFEDIGGQELINIARNDTINGQKIIYQPIKNIDSINQQYNPNNIIGIQKTSDKYFSGFAIKFDQTVPINPSSLDNNPVYMDASGNIVVESINLKADEQLEIQIAIDGTIYETEI
jgi:hypothetical protein